MLKLDSPAWARALDAWDEFARLPLTSEDEPVEIKVSRMVEGPTPVVDMHNDGDSELQLERHDPVIWGLTCPIWLVNLSPYHEYVVLIPGEDPDGPVYRLDYLDEDVDEPIRRLVWLAPDAPTLFEALAHEAIRAARAQTEVPSEAYWDGVWAVVGALRLLGDEVPASPGDEEESWTIQFTDPQPGTWCSLSQPGSQWGPTDTPTLTRTDATTFTLHVPPPPPPPPVTPDDAWRGMKGRLS